MQPETCGERCAKTRSLATMSSFSAFFILFPSLFNNILFKRTLGSVLNINTDTKQHVSASEPFWFTCSSINESTHLNTAPHGVMFPPTDLTSLSLIDPEQSKEKITWELGSFWLEAAAAESWALSLPEIFAFRFGGGGLVRSVISLCGASAADLDTAVVLGDSVLTFSRALDEFQGCWLFYDSPL